MSTMPTHRPHRSEQTVETPADLIASVAKRFGPMSFDLAATDANKKACLRFGPEDDSLQQDWTCLTGNLWLNPPYTKVSDWAKKCAESLSSPHEFDRILLLVPASIGSNWYAKYIHEIARTITLTGRVTFVGHTKPYPKDLILCSYGDKPGFECWAWRPSKLTAAERTLTLPLPEQQEAATVKQEELFALQ